MQSLQRIADPLTAYERAMGEIPDFFPGEKDALRPPPKMKVSEWADECRILQPISRQPGPWSTNTTPYLRKVMNSYNRRRTRHLVLCFGTQLGKTETIYNLLGFAIDLEPYSTLLVYPTGDAAKEISRTRIQPMVEDCSTLQAKKPKANHLYQLAEMHFPGMVLYLAGANSAAALSQKPCRNIFRDEIDKYPLRIGSDADPLSLSEERAKSFWDIRKVVDVSSPTLEHLGIWAQLQSCDVIYEYHVPCPKCGEFQKLDFERVKWITEGEGSHRLMIARNTAVYRCLECNFDIGDEYKPEMLLAGKWVADRDLEFPAEKIGFHLSSLYSPWLRWGDIAEQFIKANEAKRLGDKKPLQNFINGWLALPWQEFESVRVEDEILALKDDRDPGIVPAESVLAMTAGVDVQEHGLFFVLRAWGVDFESWKIRFGFVESFETIERVLWGSVYKDPDGREYVVNFTFMDSGYKTAEVYAFCRGRHYIFPTKGRDRMAANHTETKIDKYPNGKPIPGGVRLINLNTTFYKNWLHTKLGISAADPGAFHLHRETTFDYARQMTAEFVNDKGLWEAFRGRPNHYWDCEVLALAAADFMGLRYMGAPPVQRRRETAAKRKVKRKGGRRW